MINRVLWLVHDLSPDLAAAVTKLKQITTRRKLTARLQALPAGTLPAKMDRGSKQAQNSASRVGKETSLRGSEQAGSADP